LNLNLLGPKTIENAIRNFWNYTKNIDWRESITMSLSHATVCTSSIQCMTSFKKANDWNDTLSFFSRH